MMTAKEFRNTWLGMNPNTIHIPSEHELGLMEAYAQYYHETKVKKLSKADVSGSVCKHCGCERDKHTVLGMCLDRVKHFEAN